MNPMRIQAPLVASLAVLVLCGPAHAMDIKDYFKMADKDQARYDQSLLDSAEKALRNEGRSDVAMQLDDLFTVIKPGDQISDGFNEFLANLEDMLKAEVKREAANPNRPSLQAERAFRDVAQDHGISLPPQYETIAAGFRRQLPLRDLAK
jgi:hypothetical protein